MPVHHARLSRNIADALALVGLVVLGGISIDRNYAAHKHQADSRRICEAVPASCSPAERAVMAQESSTSLFTRFEAAAVKADIALSRHPTYTLEYVARRADVFCRLLADSAFVQISLEVSFPPIAGWLETAKGRDTLEATILDVAVQTRCPAQGEKALSWRTQSPWR